MDYNDFELVAMAQEGNEDSTNLIYQKYKPMIVKKSRNAIMYASHHGIEISDIMQEAYIGLEEAIKSFSQNDDATFYTFANLCIDRQIINYLRLITGGKNKLLNDAVYIDETLEGLIKDEEDIELSFLYKDSELILIDKVKQDLTNFENKVFDMKIKGYTISEISRKLNKDGKAIYNTIQRIKLKIKKYMENDD